MRAISASPSFFAHRRRNLPCYCPDLIEAVGMGDLDHRIAEPPEQHAGGRCRERSRHDKIGLLLDDLFGKPVVDRDLLRLPMHQRSVGIARKPGHRSDPLRRQQCEHELIRALVHRHHPQGPGPVRR
ncbi:hypothetical protein [Novosphingobium panipatense]|uniref:hypothetical protein n=1 Tax=Novosphingobium panipatense TaxID=428991 RepID=UPI00360C0BE8